MKTPEKYPEEVYEFVKEILYRYKDRVETIILFGSVARGEAREESDIDILVVGDVDLDELVEVSFPLLLKYGKLISAKDMKKSSFKKQTKEGYSFINNVLNDGVILYERVGKASGES
ncbi:MAG: nucleotidyltransferase domain-containing protein [Methanobacteriaceae archaeon]|jgi:predicted nucleotidyltransferase